MAQPAPIVILIDDDAPLRSALTFALEAQGYEVRAYDRAGAVDAGAVTGALCVVIDQGLPDGRGLDLLVRLQREGMTARAVMITTSPSAALLREAAAAGAPIVEKPLLSDDLFAVIRGGAAPVAGGATP